MTHLPKLAVWKFASCDGCQLTLLNCEDELIPLAGAGRDRLLPGGHPRRGRGPLRRLARRGLGDHTGRDRAHRAGARDVPHRGDHRRLRHQRRHPGAAQLRGRRGVPLDRLRPPGVRADARAFHADLGARDRGLRAARLPDRQAPAARGAGRVHPGPQARASPPTACASSASVAARSASRSLTGRRASGRSPRPGAAPSARPSRAAATAASARRTPRTPAPSPTGCGCSAWTRPR